MPERNLIEAIELLRKNPPSCVTDGIVRYQEVLANLDWVAAFNGTGQAYCGMASAVLMDYLPDYFQAAGLAADIVTATAAVKNGCFHHFNIVRFRGAAPLICDLTAAQFFTRPLDLLDGRPYFTGTREALKMLVRTAQMNSWHCIQAQFPAADFRTLWDVDLKIADDAAFRKACAEILREADRPCLQTESLYYAWDIIWGDTSRLLARPKTLSAAAEFNIADLVTAPAPPLANLVGIGNDDHLTRADGPRCEF